MAKKIQMWRELGPRLVKTDPVTAEEVIDLLVATTNQTRGSLLVRSDRLAPGIARSVAS